MAIEPAPAFTTIAFSQIHSLDRPDQEILFIVIVIIEMLMFRIGGFLIARDGNQIRSKIEEANSLEELNTFIVISLLLICNFISLGDIYFFHFIYGEVLFIVHEKSVYFLFHIFIISQKQLKLF